MFNPTWMDGPHVFTLDENGMVVVPGTAKTAAPAAGRPGCIGTPSLAFSKPWYTPAVRSTPKSSISSVFTSTSLPTTASSSPISGEELSRVRKPWKLATLTEQDDAEFEELMARVAAESLLQHVPLTAYADTRGAATPTSTTVTATAEGNGDGVLEPFAAEAGDRGSPHDVISIDIDATVIAEIENEAPQTPLACTVSPSSTSGVSHSDESIDIPTPRQRGERVPFMVLHEDVSSPCVDEDAELCIEQEVALEKVVIGLERLRKKAPPPLRLEGDAAAEEVGVEWSCVLLQGDAGGDADERTPVCSKVLSPLTVGLPVRPVDLPF
ncbi:hypothetical protein EDC04DRAFT_2890928 [Pisolithus marmoratus]|nr:hypothetical protein EDC04DRAFT_2890928 [Pisolithus marmoratus]